MGDTRNSLLALSIAHLPVKAHDKIVLYDFFSSKNDIGFFKSSDSDLAQIIGHPIQKAFAMDAIRSLAEKDVDYAEKLHIHCIVWSDADYPPLLRETYDPPVALFYRGKLPDPDVPLIAMVGTRHPSVGASMTAFTIAHEFGSMGYSVVSGLALGIDAMSHRGCLETKTATFAVLGSSPDEIYPKANRLLARRILERDGGLLSEYPPGTPPAKWQFPARNRIISALARGVLVVEAPQKSGALITARFALEQNRDLWVTQTDSPFGDGTAQLAEQGARVVTSATDILKEWGYAAEKHETGAYKNRKNKEELFSPENLAAELAENLGI